MRESEYLKQYNIHDFDTPLVTVDSVLFTIKDKEIKTLLTYRGEHPEKNKWSLAGGFIDIKKDAGISDCAGRKLEEKTGIKPPYLEQLMTAGGPKRDKRGWSVTIAYYALIAHKACQPKVESISQAKWFSLNELAKLDIAFDHMNIIQIALERLRQKALYSLIPAYALGKSFTLTELQHALEIILDRKIQKKSFRRRVEQANVLKEVGELKQSRGRPAILYSITSELHRYRFLRNFQE